MVESYSREHLEAIKDIWENTGQTRENNLILRVLVLYLQGTEGDVTGAKPSDRNKNERDFWIARDRIRGMAAPAAIRECVVLMYSTSSPKDKAKIDKIVGHRINIPS